MLGFLTSMGIGKVVAGGVGVAALTAGISTCSKNMTGADDKKYYREQIGKLSAENKSLVKKNHDMQIKIIKKEITLGEKEMGKIKSEWKKLDRKRKLRCEKECK